MKAAPGPTLLALVVLLPTGVVPRAMIVAHRHAGDTRAHVHAEAIDGDHDHDDDASDRDHRPGLHDEDSHAGLHLHVQPRLQRAATVATAAAVRSEVVVPDAPPPAACPRMGERVAGRSRAPPLA